MSQMASKQGPDGGQKIDDHSFWAGGRSKSSVFAMGAHSKEQMSADGAGNLPVYEDSSEKIKEAQDEGQRKIRAKPLKSHYRN